MTEQTKPQPKKEPELNPKQAMVIKKIVEGESASKAYQEVYQTKNGDVAKSNASRLLTNVNVQNALQTALRKEGINETSIAKTLIQVKNNKDWKAKSDFIDKSAKFLGYDQQNQQFQAQTNVQINLNRGEEE
jgi:hypothetical protein